MHNEFATTGFPVKRFGVNVTMSWVIPEGQSISWEPGYEIVMAPDMFVELLMELNGGKFKGEPNKAVFDHFGFDKGSVDVCGAHAKAKIHRTYDKMFEMLRQRWSDEPLPEWMKQKGVDKIMPKYVIKTIS